MATLRLCLYTIVLSNPKLAARKKPPRVSRRHHQHQPAAARRTQTPPEMSGQRAASLGEGGVAAQLVEEDDVALEPDAVLNLQPGEPMMYEAFWREVGDRAAVVIRGWQVLSYTSDDAALCWFLEPELEREVRRLHRVVGNAVVDGYHLVVGTGATQLYQAAMYALSSAAARGDHPVPVVSPAPYYSSYPPQTDLLLSDYYRWAGDANTFTGDECIELVCSPNNPDGAIREAVVRTAGAKAIHDLVYYWPQYTPITGRAAHDIMLFTLSKTTGHAGTRLGWALVKDRDVASKMVYFVDRGTIGVSRESQLRAAKDPRRRLRRLRGRSVG